MEYNNYFTDQFVKILNDEYLEEIIENYEQVLINGFLHLISETEIKEDRVKMYSYNVSNFNYDKVKTHWEEYCKEHPSNKSSEMIIYNFYNHIKNDLEDKQTFFKHFIRHGVRGHIPEIYVVARLFSKIIDDDKKREGDEKLANMKLFKLMIAHMLDDKVRQFTKQVYDYQGLETAIYPFTFKVLGIEIVKEKQEPLKYLIWYARKINPDISVNKLAKVFDVDKNTIRDIFIDEEQKGYFEKLDTQQKDSKFNIEYMELEKAQGKRKLDSAFYLRETMDEIIRQIRE